MTDPIAENGKANFAKVAKRSDAAQQLDILIEHRYEALARAVGEVDDTDPNWRASVERFNRAAEEERLQQWRDYHAGLEQLHLRLAAEHRAKVAQLANGRKRDPMGGTVTL